MLHIKNYVKTIDGKRYIDFDNILKWFSHASLVADHEIFFDLNIPDDAYNKSYCDDIEEEFVTWMLRLFKLKINSLYAEFDLSVKEKHLLQKAENCPIDGWFKLFSQKKHFFDD